MLREAADDRGLNTAALAKAAKIGRSELKQVLSGQLPLTVDMFVGLAETLALGATDFYTLTAMVQTPPAAPALSPVAHNEREALPLADALGNHASQTLRLGFALGCDMIFMLRTSDLTQSGIPEAVREKFPDHLPIRLDAAFHSHNDPRFLPESLGIKLSFDSIYSCDIPWEAFVQITLIPLATGPAEPAAEPPGGAHLRLVE
jgi:transcriptional regulator with XRE-family HTH domain